MLENYSKQTYVAMLSNNVTSSMDIESSCEIYCDLDKDIYTSIYAEGDEIKYQGKLLQNDYKEYLLTDYGWLEQASTTDMRSTIVDFFNFINKDNLSFVTEHDEDSPVDYDNNYVLESVSQSSDGVYIYYDLISIDKTTMLPKYVSIQTYQKSSDMNDANKVTDEVGNELSYTNVMMSGRIYEFAFYTENGQDWELYSEANRTLNDDETITKEKYDELAWKVEGTNETDN